MSLRLRLTLLYTTLLGGTLLLFGALVYGLVSLVLIGQLDNTLTQQAAVLTSGLLRVNANNQFDPRVADRISADRQQPDLPGLGQRPPPADRAPARLAGPTG